MISLPTARRALSRVAVTSSAVSRWGLCALGAGLSLGLALPSKALAEEVAAGSLLPRDTKVVKLDNGLQVVVLPVDTPGLVSVQTWMQVGSGEEAVAGLTGFAHFFEHLMFHGTEKMPGDVREKELLRLSVDENAWTSQDATVYHLTAPSKNVVRLLEIEADRFDALTLDDEGVRKEAGAVYGELRKGQASPGRALWAGLWATAFDVHPYHHTTLGIEADIAAMPDQLDAARIFFRTWYRPDNATLVVAGDVSPVEVMPEIERTFGKWTAKDAPAWPAIPVEPAQDGLRRSQIVWDQGPVNPRLAIGWRTPAHVPGDADAAALALVPALLTSDIAPLQRKLVDDERRARWIWSGPPDQRHPGLLLVMSELTEGEDVRAIEAEVLAAVQALVDDDSDEAKARLDMTRDRLRRETVLGLDSPGAWGSAVGSAALYGKGIDALDADVQALAAVTSDDVQRVVRKYLLSDATRTVVTLVPPEQADDSVAAPPTGPEQSADAGGAQ